MIPVSQHTRQEIQPHIRSMIVKIVQVWSKLLNFVMHQKNYAGDGVGWLSDYL